jgi:putative transposase
MSAKRNLRYHLVFVTKYRRKALEDIKFEVESAIRNAAVGSAFIVEDVAVEDGDHVHIVVRTTGTFSVGSMVNRLKASTTNKLWVDHSAILKKYYWRKDKRLLWSGGYYAATVGEASLDTIKKYLDKQ